MLGLRLALAALAFGIGRPKACLHPPGLEGLGIGNGRDLPIGRLPRQPHLQVIGLGGRKAHVTRAQGHHPIRQLQRLQDGFGMAHHRFQRRVGVLGTRHLHHFHLVELVLADHPARITAIRACLGAEARRMRSQPQRQRLARQDLARHQVRQRHLAGRNQVHRGRHRLTRSLLPGLCPGRRSLVTQLLHPEQVFLELGQLPGAEQCGSIHQIRRVALGIAMPRGVHVQHELGQCPVQARHATAHHGEPCTRELGPSGRVQPQRLAHVQMVLHREVEGGRRTPAAHLHVVGLAAAHRHRLVRQVGQAGQQRIQ